MSAAYYNEIDPFAARWLRNLATAGLIAAGDVDERSIVDVQPDDLRGYAQCHFFAGIGGWSHAARLAGLADDARLWTGSCPCQPFSNAGEQLGFDDERHLWPVWQRLIAECRPPAVLGEQVASKAADAWIDLVQADLEGLGYAVAAVPIPAAGIGAPHIRDRLWWVADADGGHAGAEGLQRGGQHGQQSADGRLGVLADSIGARLEGRDAGAVGHERQAAERGGGAGGVADASAGGQRMQPPEPAETRSGSGGHAHIRCGDGGWPGPLHGFWRDADWLLCRDGKWRPVEPSTFPLAHGVSNRVGRLRAYGNAIVPQVAAEFIAAWLECRP